MSLRGVIAASEPHTALAGARILKRGGNAVDAIVAAKLAATVTELPLTSLGGGGACIWGSAEQGYEVVDFFAATPGRGLQAWPTLDFLPITVDFGQAVQVFHIGKAAAAVPGELVGLLELHRRGGRLPLRDIVAPAANWAREGFVVSPQIAMMAAVIAPIITHSPSVAELFCPHGHIAQAGERLANPRLGEFLHALGEGDPTEQISRYWASLGEHLGPAQGGLITTQDVASYSPVVRQPLSIPFGPYTVLTNPPPSAGGGLVGAGLRLAEDLALGNEEFLSTSHQSGVASVLAGVSEIRQAGYDERLHSDPESIRTLVGGTTSPPWSATLRGQRGDENHFGATTHISVIDAQGMAAALTTSNGEGCGHALPDLGIHVNNFLGEEDINPAGFHRAAPGSWMSTMMSPTIVVSGQTPCFALGSGGSNRIRSALLQALLNLLTYRRPLDEAINAARMHIEGDKLWFEDVGLSSATAAALYRRWPEATRFTAPSMFFGGVNCAARLDGRLCGAGDRRRGGVVVVAESS